MNAPYDVIHAAELAYAAAAKATEAEASAAFRCRAGTDGERFMRYVQDYAGEAQTTAYQCAQAVRKYRMAGNQADRDEATEQASGLLRMTRDAASRAILQAERVR